MFYLFSPVVESFLLLYIEGEKSYCAVARCGENRLESSSQENWNHTPSSQLAVSIAGNHLFWIQRRSLSSKGIRTSTFYCLFLHETFKASTEITAMSGSIKLFHHLKGNAEIFKLQRFERDGETGVRTSQVKYLEDALRGATDENGQRPP